MQRCEYPGCKREDINEFKMCPDHHIDYPEKNMFNEKRIQKRFQRLIAQAPESVEQQEKDLKGLVQEHLFEFKKSEQESLYEN